MRQLVLACAMVFGVGLSALTGCGGEDDACDACSDSQLCLQLHDGTCELQVRCVAKIVGNVDCSKDECDPACELAYCESPYQCGIRVACGDEVAGAFQCYGP